MRLEVEGGSTHQTARARLTARPTDAPNHTVPEHEDLENN